MVILTAMNYYNNRGTPTSYTAMKKYIQFRVNFEYFSSSMVTEFLNKLMKKVVLHFNY